MMKQTLLNSFKGDDMLITSSCFVMKTTVANGPEKNTYDPQSCKYY